MRIATVQTCPQFKQVKRNLRTLVSLVQQAARAGAQLTVLPECATTGYSFMSKADALPYAEELDAPQPGALSSVAVFRALAKKHQMHIVWGLIERDNGTGNLHNTQVLVCPDGSLESYRKICLFSTDFLWASPGRANPPVRRITVGGLTYRVGLLVCRDVRDKKDSSWTSFYEPGDADVVCLSANWGRGAFPALAWITFAKDNQVTLAISNRYGEEVPNDFGHGGIAIISPDGRVFCDGLAWDAECLVVNDI